MVTPELANYARRCRDPRFVATAASALVSRAMSALLRRTPLRRPDRSLPDAVLRARRSVLAQPDVEPDVSDASADRAATVPARRLTLTGGATIVRDAGDWRQSFADPEVAASLHRWNWLLYGVTTDPEVLPRTDAIALMRSWIAACHRDAAGRDGPYTTGERLVNGLLFLMRDPKGDVPRDIAVAFRQMARFVAEHLEYHPGGLTGNHAFNNARALLFAGVFLGDSRARDLAYAVAAERLPVLVTDDGFLREGSAHYHLLFTRWVLEMLWVVQSAHDGEFSALLLPFAHRLVSRCWFFVVSRANGDASIPLIGDISPDFPPDWLVGLPWSALALSVFTPTHLPPAPGAAGWASLLAPTRSGTADSRRTQRFESFPASGWCRADVGAWTLVVRARSHDGVPRSGHEHADLGSFTLFRDGAPFVIDCGRIDYSNSPISAYGPSAAAHNAPIVDGLGVMLLGPSWFAPHYASVRVAMQAMASESGCRIDIGHDGFRRLTGEPVSHRRALILDSSGLRVDDHFDGRGSRHVHWQLHFAPDVSGAQTGRTWSLGTAHGTLRIDPSLTVAMVEGNVRSPVGGLYFPVYGEVQPITTLQAGGRITLPAVLSHRLSDERA